MHYITLQGLQSSDFLKCGDVSEKIAGLARIALFDGDFVSKTIAPAQRCFSFGREEARQALLRPKLNLTRAVDCAKLL
ncbi:MAG TPA: hypothetical protein IAA64_03175 [Candidatus Ornithocaccomicrobium faecavium]|uniref:Uncharacterized protein n=1 Tax=Candidatus Ornithocaccomicrobium faecavium TaxID=2840890 RepID=A0A9D1P6J9_9FIRM|nr:hypothetical protein [Clostridiales bacterium]HIV26946.1 hypothetical protein [Candidatus Ornithocaccomicrobium faecavium]